MHDRIVVGVSVLLFGLAVMPAMAAKRTPVKSGALDICSAIDGGTRRSNETHEGCCGTRKNSSGKVIEKYCVVCEKDSQGRTTDTCWMTVDTAMPPPPGGPRTTAPRPPVLPPKTP